jgi:hypothetical protein
MALTSTVFSAIANPENKPVTIRNKTGASVISYANSRALVIWVGDYKIWPKLSHVKNEAEQIRAALEKHGFLVKMSEGFTAQDIKSSLDSFTAEYAYRKDVDRIVIFFTGHGLSRNRNGFLIAADSPEPQFSGDIVDTQFFMKTVPMERFYQEIATLYTSKHILFILDTCFSGSIFKNKPNLPVIDNTSLVNINNLSRQVITAGDESQEVPEKSIFTPLFINAINGSADSNQDGIVTGSEIASYLMTQVPKKASLSNHPQSPQYGRIAASAKNDMSFGEIVFKKVNLSSSQPITELKIPEIASKRRSSYAVEYFGKGKVNDSNHVESVLHKLGFTQAKLPSQKDATISDSIWVGDAVNIEDVKVLAYSLIQDGVRLESIRTFDKKSSNIKRPKLIQIGADLDLGVNCKPLTTQQIQMATRIDRTTLVCGK